MRNGGDDEIRAELTRRGTSPAVAEQALALIPLAFGRELIAQMDVTVPDEGIVMREDRSQQTIRLADNAIFRRARRLIEEGFKYGTISKDEFEAVMMRSSEVRALNRALHGGSKPQDLVFSPPVIVASYDWADSEPSAATSTAARPKKKPWWRFW
jgi:hypothetical protein